MVCILDRKEEPGQSTTLATQELLRLVEANPNGLPAVDPVKDLHIQDLDLVENFRRMKFLEESLPLYKCIHDPSFGENVSLQISYYLNKIDFGFVG